MSYPIIAAYAFATPWQKCRLQKGSSLCVAIDRTPGFAFARLVEKANRKTATAFPENLIRAVPYKIHAILTDSGIRFVLPPRYRDGASVK